MCRPAIARERRIPFMVQTGELLRPSLVTRRAAPPLDDTTKTSACAPRCSAYATSFPSGEKLQPTRFPYATATSSPTSRATTSRRPFSSETGRYPRILRPSEDQDSGNAFRASSRGLPPLLGTTNRHSPYWPHVCRNTTQRPSGESCGEPPCASRRLCEPSGAAIQTSSPPPRRNFVYAIAFKRWCELPQPVAATAAVATATAPSFTTVPVP